jgi:indolepyruvate ferredoxin oxidoreductase
MAAVVPTDLRDPMADYRLVDRYVRDDGRAFLSGSQALARLPFEQLRADRRAGWNTAAYVTGYPGSPLANYDKDIRAVAAIAEADGHRLVFQPGLNEELAATAVMGSQLSVTLGSSRYDGVIGFWYGKGPGLDRASDAIRHAVFAGTSSRGGAVALVGDDPSAKSSTIPSSSDATLMDLHIPVLYPGDVQEALDLGRHAIALSRTCGLWTSIKVVEAVADGTGTVEFHPDRVRPVIPTVDVDGTTFVPMPSGKLLTPYTLELEREFQHVRLELARRYGADNHLNTIAVRGPQDWIGIVATGHTYREMLEGLRLLGLHTDDDLRAAGIRLLKLGLPIPLDAALVRQFASGLTEIVVVEEKNPTLELFVKDALYSQNERPIVCGKYAPDGNALLPLTGRLTADTIAPHLRSRVLQRLAPERLAPPAADDSSAVRRLIPLTVNRTPYFCSGCPHNTSTKVPDGVLVGGGIGCHSMVMFMEPEQVGDIVGLTAMGNEGAQWFGIAPFVDDHHLIQNIGDGTLFHSGMLAVRAAVANGVNITYKVLYNGAVAMTGGQHPFGQLDVPSLVKVFLAEGVNRIIITTDDIGRYQSVALPVGVQVWDRGRLVEAQQQLAEITGTTVLIHDQRCAAELRRDRKRGKATTPDFRVVIDERVCEGCGHCGTASNCLSVQPHDTPFGRKTTIDPASCNLDASCLQGDCPSFLTVTPRRPRRPRGSAPRRAVTPALADLDAPTDLNDPISDTPVDDFTIRLSGVGGTGVVTVSQIIGTAAMLDGYQVRGLDQTGLSQKAGPVVSDVRLSRNLPRPSNRATDGSVDTLLAFDMLVAASDAHLAGISPGRTAVVANSAQAPTGSMVIHPGIAFPGAAVHQRLSARSRSLITTNSVRATIDALGDPATANVYLLGVAVQRGVVPVRVDSIERAIRLNEVAVDTNLTAFRLGRRTAVDMARPDVVAMSEDGSIDAVGDEPLDRLIDRLRDDLVAYQHITYGRRFADVVQRARTTGSGSLTRAVAVHLHKLMAYKDEYEVARLLLLPSSRAAAEAVGGPGARVQWNLHPPLLRSLGLRHKIRLGRWSTPAMHALRAARRVRGTPLDVFGHAALRRLERQMIDEYVAAIDVLATSWDPAREGEAVAIASLPDEVRGYEGVKAARVQTYRTELATRLTSWQA